MSLKKYSLALALLISIFSATGIAHAADSDETYLGDDELITFPQADGVGNPCRLRLEKIGSREIKVGSFATYFIRLENVSQCIFTDIDVTDILPDRTQFVSANPKPDFVHTPDPFGGTVGWEDISLKPGQVKYLEVQVHVVGPPNRDITNTACVRNKHLGPHKFCKKFESRVVTGSPGLQ
jgi:uncharacterized repeat protein (TIGR01451 family)